MTARRLLGSTAQQYVKQMPGRTFVQVAQLPLGGGGGGGELDAEGWGAPARISLRCWPRTRGRSGPGWSPRAPGAPAPPAAAALSPAERPEPAHLTCCSAHRALDALFMRACPHRRHARHTAVMRSELPRVRRREGLWYLVRNTPLRKVSEPAAIILVLLCRSSSGSASDNDNTSASGFRPVRRLSIR